MPNAFRIDTWDRRSILWLESSRLEEGLAYYREHKLNGIGLNFTLGYKLDNLRFVAEQSDVRGLVLVPLYDIDLSGIENLNGLRFLSTGKQNKYPPLDLAAFPHLEEYRGQWWPKLRIPASDCISHLALWSYAPGTRDLTSLPNLTALKRLELIQGRIESLAGLERFRSLGELTLAYLPKLESLEPVKQLAELETLNLERCRRIQGYDILTKLRSLKTLRISACAPIPSLGFVRECLSLEFLSFVQTRVLDGDLTPTFGLKYVGFLNQRGLSHTSSQVKAILRERAAGEDSGGT